MASGSIVRPFVVPDGLSQIELGEEIDLMLKSGRAIVWQNGQGALIGLDIAPLTSTGEEARLAFLQKWRSLLPSCEFSSELISTDSSSYHRHSSKLQEIFDLSTPTDCSVFHVGHDSVRIFFKGNFTVDNGLLGSTLQLAMYLKVSYYVFLKYLNTKVILKALPLPRSAFPLQSKKTEKSRTLFLI